MSRGGVFGRLLALHRRDSIQLEDYFTEILANFLQHCEPACVKWLQSLGLGWTNPESIRVSTQTEMSGLPHHDRDSRFDLCIDFTSGGTPCRVVVESKVGSTEHDDQIKRYMELLADSPFSGHSALVYVTRDHEEPKKHTILPGVEFQQRRWDDFYHLLVKMGDAGKSDDLRREVILFMKEQHMVDRKQFDACDLLALRNFSPALEVVKSTLSMKVCSAFNKAFNADSKPAFRPASNRYAISVAFEGGLECVLGCWFYDDIQFPFPVAGVHLNVDGSKVARLEIGRALKDIADQRHWRRYRDLVAAQGFAGIAQERSFAAFLEGKDHVKAIADYFLLLISEVQKIMESTPGLPNRTVSGGQEQAE